jgi:hypothetical protein
VTRFTSASRLFPSVKSGVCGFDFAISLELDVLFVSLIQMCIERMHMLV